MAGKKNKSILQQIARSYGLSVRKVRSYSSQYKKVAAYRVTTDKGTYMIKPFVGTRRRLMALASYAARLRGKGSAACRGGLEQGRGSIGSCRTGSSIT
ncbi:hypothetical protein LJK88_11835 [Paenibacillus sp. P26]|nr:hypothetical protein LJK88_11835 [Paenibacillus sp. P26]UUZ89532.1 hypothetical protein LJK87_25850 [Paenibacillus sp. P25]